MCGILGQLNFRERVRKSDIDEMSKALFHRGPDGHGTWYDNEMKIGLGHRRLSILDLSKNGKQPMVSHCGRYVITFNGEIYNYQELKKLLPFKEFVSQSDTEVLLELYAHMGPKALEHLNGMFAFAIWDQEKQELFCARDRFGEKPFHYHYENGKFTFASEIKAFWPAGITKKVNQTALFNYLINNTIEDPFERESTFYKNIQKLDASSYIILNGEDLKIHKYYNIPINKNNLHISFGEAQEEIRRLFSDSIKLRLRSDVEVGSSFSGGIDSSIIVSSINKVRGKKGLPFNTFSARFKNFSKDEGDFMQAVHEVTDTNAYNTWITGKDFAEDFKEVSYYQDEPFGSSSICAQFRVMKLAKETGTTVLLDGQGADEYFAGYPFYLNNYYKNLKKKNSFLFQEELKSYEEKNGRSWNKPIRNKLLNEYPDILQKCQSIKSFFSQDEYKQLFERNMYNQYRRRDNFHKLNLKERLNHSLFSGELQELLRYADRNSMAHSREVRLPYLDHRLVEFVLSLPEEYLIKNSYSKYILRKSFENDLPQKVIWRKEKVGFEPPQNEWLKDLNLDDFRFESFAQFDKKVYTQNFNISAATLYL